MKEFAERFHLSNPSKGFEITPWDPDDAKVYFGDKALDLQLRHRVEAGYSLGKPPKIYLLGRWGSGKTHHLYHLKYVLEKEGVGSLTGFISPYLQIECEDTTEFTYLHRKMLNALGIEVVKAAVSDFLMGAGPLRSAAQKTMFGSDNLIKATQVLSIGDDQLAWKWISGEALSGAELRSLSVTNNLEDTVEMVDVLVRIGRLLLDQGKHVLFFIDEGEALKHVSKPNAQSSWHDGFRNLADNKNNSIGFVLAIFQDNNNPTPDFITEEDVMRRLGQQNLVTLEPLDEPSKIEPFLQDLIQSRVKVNEVAGMPPDVSAASYPFHADALDLFVQELHAGAVSATPSKIIEGLSECAWEAHTRDEDFITVQVVQEVMPRVTAAI